MVTGLVAILAAGCSLLPGNLVAGSGELVEREYAVAAFSGIVARSMFDVEVVLGAPDQVLVTVDDNVEDRLRVEVEDDVLYLGLQPGTGFRGATMRATVTVPDLTHVGTSGLAELRIDQGVTTKTLSMEASGSSRIVADVLVDELTVHASGSSNVWLSGVTDRAELRASGRSTLALAPLTVGRLDAELSGSSSAELTLDGEARVDLSGASELTWDGDGRIVEETVSSGARLVER